MTTIGIASPTIAEALAQFLAEQKQRLAPKTFAQYERVIELLQDSLNRYAYQSLDEAQSELFDGLYNAKGDDHREFCEIFGPEHILPNVGEFLGYFMVRKVIAGKDLLRAAGTVTKKLARWLADKGYAQPEEVEDAEERGASAAKDLPEAEELASRLRDFADRQKRGGESNEVEDQFLITHVEGGEIWLEGMLDGRELGPIALPGDLPHRCKVGWTVSGVVGRVRNKWALVEVWNVYPD